MVRPEAHSLEQLSGRSSLHNDCDVPHRPTELARESIQGFSHELFKLPTAHFSTPSDSAKPFTPRSSLSRRTIMPALGSTHNSVSIECLKERFAGIWYRVLRRWSSASTRRAGPAPPLALLPSGQVPPARCPTIPGGKRPLACPAGGLLGVHSRGTGAKKALEFLSTPETDASKRL